MTIKDMIKRANGKRGVIVKSTRLAWFDLAWSDRHPWFAFKHPCGICKREDEHIHLRKGRK